MNTLDTIVLLSALLAAIVLYGIRKGRRRISAPGQFLMDWLGAWTIVELIMIGVATMNHAVLAKLGIYPPSPTEVIRTNGLLMPISMMYCAALVGKNTVLATWEAIKEPAKAPDDEPKGSER